MQLTHNDSTDERCESSNEELNSIGVESVLSRLYNVTEPEPHVKGLTTPMTSTRDLLNRAKMFLPQIHAANQGLDYNTTSFVEIIDRNDDVDSNKNTKKRKHEQTQSIIEMVIFFENLFIKFLRI
jgi:hypothetical protein